jgi:putative transposase
LGPAAKRQLAEEMVREERLPVSRACKLTSLPRSQYYYKSLKDDTTVSDALQKLSADHPTYGFRKLFAYLRRDGHDWNHKKVYRVYRQLKMNRRRKGKRRLPARIKQPLIQPPCANESWSMDFMSDSMVDGRKLRTLNIIDDCNREALAIEVDTSLSSKRVIRVLNKVIEQRGKPKVIRVDNGPEFTSKDFELWCREQQINIQFIQPGRPMQNGFIERFNGSYRREILDAYVFFELHEVRKITAEWIDEYNYRRPHEGLNNATPKEWLEKIRSGNEPNAVEAFVPLPDLKE